MNFSIKEAFVFGWNSTREYFFQVLVVLGIVLVVNFILRFLFDSFVGTALSLQTILLVLLVVLFIIFEIFLQIGVIKQALNVVRGGKIQLNKLFSHSDYFIRIIIGWIVYGLSILVFTILALLPFFVLGTVTGFQFLFILGFFVSLVVCIYTILTLGFARFVVIEQGSGPLQSLRISEEITRGSRGKLFLFFVLAGLLNLVGFLLLFLGLIVTIPVSFFALIWVYDQLLKKRLTAEQK